MATGLENLKVYNIAADLEVEMHHLTKTFPNDEKYRTVDQLRRSSAAVTNNIAEGYARHSHKENIRFLYIAKGEAEETKHNILRCARKELVEEATAKQTAEKYTELLKALSGYIKFVKGKMSDPS